MIPDYRVAGAWVRPALMGNGKAQPVSLWYVHGWWLDALLAGLGLLVHGVIFLIFFFKLKGASESWLPRLEGLWVVF
jgi:hypothetical protein